MRLNSKFAIVVVFTAILVMFLTLFMLHSSAKLQSIKHYQYMQQKAASELRDVIFYLDELDNWGFNTNTAYREWVEKKEPLDQDFEYMLYDPVTENLGSEYKKSLKEMETIWGLLNQRFESLEEQLQEIEQIELSMSVSNEVEKDGVRSAEKNFEGDEGLDRIMELVESIHSSLKGIRRSYFNLSRIYSQSENNLQDILDEKVMDSNRRGIMLAVFTCFILGLLIYEVTSGVTRRIRKIRDVTSTLSKKNFGVTIKPQGSSEMVSLMKNINGMVDQINEFFDIVKTTASEAISSGYSIKDAANNTANATTEIDNNIQKINKLFEKVNDSVKSAVMVINEMNSQVDVLVENNGKQSEIAAKSNESVKEAVETLSGISKMAMNRKHNAEEMHVLIADGDDKISTTNNLLTQITSQLDEIKEVVTIINDVAEQTNLLSMNAAIESSHAGEAGKGFAVVAEEIRTLAIETSENAARINGVVTAVVDSVSNANISSNEASQAFEKVRSHAEEVIDSFHEITDGIEKVDEKIQQIKEKTAESADASKDINSYCKVLAEKQRDVSNEVDKMNDLFVKSVYEIKKIKEGTSDIVDKMKNVTNSTEESYKIMTDLEDVLKEFKTKKEVSEAEIQADLLYAGDNVEQKMDEIIRSTTEEYGNMKNLDEIKIDLNEFEELIGE